MAKITWTNKTTLNPQPSIARENKVIDDDMNEIKQVVNTNDDNVGDLTSLDTTDKTSIVNAINEVKGQLKTAQVYSADKSLSTSVADTNNVITVDAVNGTVLMYFITYAQPLANWDNGALVEIGAMFHSTNQLWLKTSSAQNYRLRISALYIEN
jgi:hypothetical protein